MKIVQRGNTFTIKNPSPEMERFVIKLQSDKDKRKEELLKQEKFTFTVQV